MSRVAIITIIDNDNYGNRLQNYALQEILKHMGNEVITFENYHFLNKKKLYYLRRIKYRKHNKYFSVNKNRAFNFKKFNEKIKFSKHIYNPNKKYNEIDYFIVGSDQVWHPVFGVSDATMLVDKEPKKRIAYAASIGVNEIQVKEHYKYSELQNFSAISVREKRAAEIIDKMTGLYPKTVIDPTLFLDSDLWEKVEHIPAVIDEPYILTYYLGDRGKYQQHIEYISHKYGLKVINLLDKNDDFYVSGPSEFLYLVHHAKLVLTDSFHGCVFSFIYRTPFLVYHRIDGSDKENTRINNLLETFCLETKWYERADELEIFDANYDEGYKQLATEREKALNFLREALDIQNGNNK